MGDWWSDFTDYLSGGGSSEALDNIDYGGGWSTADSGGYDLNDYLAGVSDNIDIGGGWNPSGDSVSSGTNTPNEVVATGSNSDSENYGNYGGGGYSLGYGDTTTSSQPKSLWDKTSDFLSDKSNENMIKLGTSLGGNILGRLEKGMDAKKADQKLQELREYNDKVQKEKEDRADARAAASRGGGGGSALDTLAAKDAIDQANKAKYSASVSGLRPSGLIHSRKKLTYVGGKPVFTDAGQLAQ